MALRPVESGTQVLRKRVHLFLNIILAVTGVIAVATLVLQHGGFPDIVKQYGPLLQIVQGVIVAVLVLDRLIRLLIAPRKWAYIKENWTDFLLILILLTAMAILARFRTPFLSAGMLYAAIMQAYILLMLLGHALNANLVVAESGLHPTWMLVGSFAFMCIAGSGLLMLPIATPDDSPQLYYSDALFTAVSATCVTGLVVRDTGTEFTTFGQIVILTLIQLGGLGIMIFGTVMALLIGKGLSTRGSYALGEMVGTSGPGELTRAVKFVVTITLVFEAIGAMAMYPMFADALDGYGREMTAIGAGWHAVFHSISSFCNAGFALYRNNMMQGVYESGWKTPLRGYWQIMGVMAPLIVLGGLGFPVLQDLARYGKDILRRLAKPLHLWNVWKEDIPMRPRLSLHSRIVLGTSAVLIVIGALLFFLVEIPNVESQRSIGRHEIYQSGQQTQTDWESMGYLRRMQASLFQSITARTAGFNTVDMNELSSAGKLTIAALMIVGGSPASTAGGIKTVTFALILIAAISVLQRRDEIEIHRRSLSMQLLRRTVTLAILYVGLLFGVTLLLCVTMQGYDFINLFFEACSACGTVGLSTGITGELTLPAKYVVILAMFTGRLGPLTLLLALTSRIKRVQYQYPTEDVLIG